MKKGVLSSLFIFFPLLGFLHLEQFSAHGSSQEMTAEQMRTLVASPWYLDTSLLASGLATWTSVFLGYWPLNMLDPERYHLRMEGTACESEGPCFI